MPLQIKRNRQLAKILVKEAVGKSDILFEIIEKCWARVETVDPSGVTTNDTT